MASDTHKCRTWDATWVGDLQYAYDTGIFEGVAIYAGLMGMFDAIRERTAADEHRRRLEAVCGPLDEPCSACGVEIGEGCKPDCVANAGHYTLLDYDCPPYEGDASDSPSTETKT